MASEKKKVSSVWVISAVLLVLAAAAAGYFLTKSWRDGLEAAKADDPGVLLPAENEGTGDVPGSRTALSLTPVDLVYVVNSETGRIEHMLVEILDCTGGRLEYIGIPTEVSYTMSAGLYSSLTPDNTELPQTVTFSELYRYYHSDRAYDAGRRIAGEMLNFNILYYTAVTDADIEGFVSFGSADGAETMEFTVDRDFAGSAYYGTEGSMKGIIGAALSGAATNWDVSERLRYLEVYDGLGAEDVTFTAAPVIAKNETTSLDTAATGAILYGILY